MIWFWELSGHTVAKAPDPNLWSCTPVNLSLAIEECRKLKGVTTSRLALDAGLSTPYLSQIINGKREPSLSAIEKISAGLGIPSSILVFLASDESELKSISKELQFEFKNVAKHLIKESAVSPSISKVFSD